jgi:hypothetical protein
MQPPFRPLRLNATAIQHFSDHAQGFALIVQALNPCKLFLFQHVLDQQAVRPEFPPVRRVPADPLSSAGVAGGNYG